ncbi:hypothetical protein GCWU000324_01554 [Kingella oralis ATCC 51147]|uniref:Uncharacterized protein n=1 Tax=Kingella oralis ATCC 51147 TaxID=629741 RepID=C4GKP9_9NEIS|nr:hypothetical protein GCWU000324_01554 [Kingella oralis ATCC 51147]
MDNGAGHGSVLQNVLRSFSGCLMWMMAIKKSLQPRLQRFYETLISIWFLCK